MASTRRTLTQRAKAAAKRLRHYTVEYVWKRGYQSGVAAERKRTAALLKDAEQRTRRAEETAERFKAENARVSRYADAMNDRLPANSGGFSPNG